MAPASVSAGNTSYNIALGKENAVVGQASAVDVDVPTGCVIKEIAIQFAVANLVNVAAFCHMSIQKLRSGTSAVNPNVAGGNPLRNQIFYQKLYSIGQNQNSDFIKNFKVPPKFQRMRDGDTWLIRVNVDQIATHVAQFIYKFYR